ncbi:MAG TPA: prolyl aminopeptidase [Steroidobacteraceae bacterium]|nr:prolyl aminopeptidase [Steroidobacteraceae bacterium]
MKRNAKKGRKLTRKAALRTLYPAIEPFRRGRLKVSDVHDLYYEECGNPKGKPVVFVHGGPGAGAGEKSRSFFDPKHYRIVLFDQRGCGRSRPHASLVENTTWHLVDDMEKLRERLGIERWQVFGGSWGSTLGLAYAQAHPDRVSELVVRGIFLLRRWELDWFYQAGAGYLYPERWKLFLAPIPLEERGDLLQAYHRRVTGSDAKVARRAARAWSVWEASTSYLRPNEENVKSWSADKFAMAIARIECHYFVNKGFFYTEDQLIRNAERLRHIPGVIVQGRYDIVCPAASAWELHEAWPEAHFRIVPDAGHAALEPGIAHELVCATDLFR